MTALRVPLTFAILLIATAAQAGAVDGAKVFAENCAACHQAQGQGIPGAFPALAGDFFVQGPADLAAKTVLNGRGGMPSFSADLTDEQIAAVLSHIRASWGNHAPPIAPDLVAAARKGAVVETRSPMPGH